MHLLLVIFAALAIKHEIVLKIKLLFHKQAKSTDAGSESLRRELKIICDEHKTEMTCFYSVTTKKIYVMKMRREQTLQRFDKRTVSLKKLIVFFLWLITGKCFCF